MEERTSLDEIILEEEKVDVPVSEKEPIQISGEAEKANEELQKIAPKSNSGEVKTASASKTWLVALLFLSVNLVSILLSAVMEFSSEQSLVNISAVWGTFKENWVWAIVGIAIVLITIFFEGFKRFILLRTTLKKNLPIESINAGLLCKYYDSVTPFGAGGQPFEIVYLRKKGLPIGVASSVPLVSYSLKKIAYVLVSFISIIFCGFGEVTSFIKILCLVGLIINSLIPVAIVMFAFMPKFSNAIARFIAKAGKKMRLVKNEQEFLTKITGSFVEYGEYISYFIKKSKLSILISFLCSIAYYIALYSLPYVTIRLCGNHNANWGQMLTYCVICYASITLLPTPGNSGGAELSFRSIFESYLSGGILFWGMLTWRILSYYLFIIFGFILIVAQYVKRFINKEWVIEKAKQTAKIEPEDELEPYSPIPPTVPTAEDDINTAFPVSIAEATLEPDVEEPIQPEEIANIPETFESVVEFTAVIESKSTLTITEEHIEVNDTPVEELHQITLDELVTPPTNEDNASTEEPQQTDAQTPAEQIQEVVVCEPVTTSADQTNSQQPQSDTADEDPID